MMNSVTSRAPHVLLLVFSLGGALACSPAPGVRDISPEVLLSRPANSGMLILDVRSPEEFGGGHVPGAVNIPYDQVEGRLAEIEPHRGDDIVIYCEKGGRAGKAADVLLEAEFPNLLHLAGDMSEWRAAGRELARP
jgi:phage shock protein E